MAACDGMCCYAEHVNSLMLNVAKCITCVSQEAGVHAIFAAYLHLLVSTVDITVEGPRSEDRQRNLRCMELA